MRGRVRGRARIAGAWAIALFEKMLRPHPRLLPPCLFFGLRVWDLGFTVYSAASAVEGVEWQVRVTLGLCLTCDV